MRIHGCQLCTYALSLAVVEGVFCPVPACSAFTMADDTIMVSIDHVDVAGTLSSKVLRIMSPAQVPVSDLLPAIADKFNVPLGQDHGLFLTKPDGKGGSWVSETRSTLNMYVSIQVWCE